MKKKTPLNIISVISWSTTFWITQWVHLDHWQMTRWMFAIKEGRTGQSRLWAWLTKRGVLIRDTWDTGPTEHSALNETRQGNTISHTVIQNNRLASSRNGSFWLLNCLQTCGCTNWNLVGFFLLGINEEHVGEETQEEFNSLGEKELINTAENDSPWMNLRLWALHVGNKLIYLFLVLINQKKKTRIRIKNSNSSSIVREIKENYHEFEKNVI